MDRTDKIKDQVSVLPDRPGVYMFKDGEGRVIYIGKAKSLKKRVGSYFSRFLSDKTQALVSNISEIEYILSPSETQAQLLEASLIKDKQPYYNVSLKDDKSFPLIKISDAEFPVISICRRKKVIPADKSLYFGPYTNSAFLRQAFKVMRRIFGFRSCPKMPKEPCLYFRLKLCPAPCIGNINFRQYKELIKEIILFLESKYEKLIDSLTVKMRIAAKEKNFEEAAKIRDQISALSVFSKGKEHVNGLDELEDLKNLLHMDKLPERIEAFDISNISGKEAAGSMVSFYKGLPDKSNYRRFRIKTITRIDDYSMLREVVKRRYTRIKEENLALPDLVLIDGGKSHLEAARDEIKRVGFSIPLMSIAKEKENIYIAGRPLPARLESDTPALNLIRRIRDEAHRFAVAYHHVLRRKKVLGK
ncbi:MAG: excinuclease ABC subunit UvrC [Candidatus Omnitrophota bacterium]